MKTLLRGGLSGFAAPILGLSILLTACGGGSAVAVAQPSVFPNTQNLPMLQIKDRVINLNAKSGYQYAKLSLNVLFSDPMCYFGKHKGLPLNPLQRTSDPDNP